MNAEQRALLEKLFDEAVSLPAEKRDCFLAESCPDPEIRSEVESLLRHAITASTIEGVRSAIQAMAVGITTQPAETSSTPLPDFGVYHAIGVLGEGGMGIVYLAEQREPIRRRVALKVLRHGDRASSVTTRFASESQALALMEHPNIARVYEVGTTAPGQPYFAMEYVPGIPISDYCDRHLLGCRDRLELFRRVCQGVHHAHQKGIVHRDLKPSNILVMEQDGKPVPKIIDFGIAKAVNQRLVERTLSTEIGVIIGTPEYMSPEQADFMGPDVDSRTDIYSLGVLLYELLVGALPFDSKTLRNAGYAEIQRMIRDVEPPKPSLRLSNFGAGAREIARRRQSDVRNLIRLVRGDLETITMKALEKNRTRRYESAAELASDIERFLAQKPIAARPPDLTYQIGKFLKRQRLTLYSICAAILLAGFTALFFWWRTPQSLPEILSVTQLTDDGTQKYGLQTDGSWLYFTENLTKIVRVPVTGGPVVPVLTSLPNPYPVAVTPDSSALLVAAGTPTQPSACFLCFPVWTVQLPPGKVQKLTNLEANDVGYFPDGRQILFGTSQGIEITNSDGKGSRLLARLDGAVWAPRVSPDQLRMRFFRWNTYTDSNGLWEGGIDGRNLRELSKEWPALSKMGYSSRSGNWTAGGRYFVFGAELKGRVDLWALPEQTGLFDRKHAEPVRLTNGPLSYTYSIPSRDGTKMFAVGTVRRGELVRLDSAAHQFVPFLSGVSANEIVFSRDGKWAVYTTYPDHSLWRSRLDGSDRRRLTHPPLMAYRPHVSPDGTRVAFFSTKPTTDIYVVGIEDGNPRLVRQNAFGPVWSPDGNKLAFDAPAKVSFRAHILDLNTGVTTAIPDGMLKFTVSWSPSNRLVAVNLAHTKVLAFDFPTATWSPLLSADISERNMFDGAPSVDGRYLYIDVNRPPNPKVIRIRVSDGFTEPVIEINGLRRVVDPFEGSTLGVAPDGSFLVTRDVGVEEVFALNLKWP